MTNESADGEIKAVHWSPGGHYVAVDVVQKNPDDSVWIIKLADGEVIKQPGFGISRAMMGPASEEIQKVAARQWGNLEEKNRQWAQHYSCTSIGWESDHVLRMNFTGHYGEADQPAEPPPQITIHGFFDYSKGTEDIRFSSTSGHELKEDTIDGSWSEIRSPRLHANQLFSVDRDNNNVSFGVFWMERFGANQFVAHVNDVDWSKARIVEDINGGGFAGATSISVPMREGMSHEAMTWSPDTGYSSEAPPWSEKVPPVSRKQSNEPILLYAADRKSADALVALFRKFPVMPESCKDKVPFDHTTSFPGERYPQTRLGMISEEDFSNLVSEDLRYAINEMFARHGAFFGSSEVLAMFEGFDWYRPMVTKSFDEIEEGFTEHEKRNLKILGGLRERKR